MVLKRKKRTAMYCLCRSSKTISVRIIFLDDSDFLYEIQVRSYAFYISHFYILNYYNSLRSVFPLNCHTHRSRLNVSFPFILALSAWTFSSSWILMAVLEQHKMCLLTQWIFHDFFSLSLSLRIMLFLCDTLHQQLLKEKDFIWQQLEAVNLSLTLSLFSTPCHYCCYYFPTQPVTRWQTIHQVCVCASMKAHFNNNDDNFSPPQ